MATRGPKPGWKQSGLIEAKETPPAPVDPTKVPEVQVVNPPEPTAQRLTAADLENPSKISGQMLKDLAHKRGLSRSSMEDMPDDKIREQLRYITQNQYEDA